MRKMHEAQLLQNGAVGVIPTDTVYGLVAQALNPEAVARVYPIKGRAPEKPCIILITSFDDLQLFGVSLSSDQRSICSVQWPGPVSIILSCEAASLEYLHRGTKTLAFRLPADEQLRELVKASGPLIAPSANPEGKPPATTVEDARAYFGNSVDFYIDGGLRNAKPSRLISVSEDGTVQILRS